MKEEGKKVKEANNNSTAGTQAGGQGGEAREEEGEDAKTSQEKAGLADVEAEEIRGGRACVQCLAK